MELELVPIEGRTVLTEEEKERLRRRARPIPPEVLRAFSDAEQKDMKDFLTTLMILTEQFHHDLEHKDAIDDYDDCIAELQTRRQALFDNPSQTRAQFIELLQFYAMETWQEFEMMIGGVRGEDLERYYETKLKTAVDPYHMRVEDGVEKAQEERMVLERKCRITPKEIRDLVAYHSLESLVKHLIEARRLISGEFWNVGHYDL